MKRIKPGRLIILIIILTMGYFIFFGRSGIINLYRLHQKSENLKAEMNQLKTKIDSLHNEIEKLKNDTVYIEKIAREKLGMAKPNEKIFKFSEKE